jgi:F-type H+-transporting ATPase subunit b
VVTRAWPCHHGGEQNRERPVDSASFSIETGGLTVGTVLMLRRLETFRLLGAFTAVALCAALAGPLLAQESHAPAAKASHAASAEDKRHAASAEDTRMEESVIADTEDITNPLQAEPALAFWTVIVFAGLLFLLGKYAWTPLMTALHDREHGLERTLEETERARHESEKVLAEHKAVMARAADDVRAILEKARVDAQTAADQIVKAAQAEAEASRQRAVRDINTAKDQALTEIWTKSAEVAVSVAGKVLSKQLGEEDHRRLLDAAISELPGVIDTTVGSPSGSHA